MNLRELAELRGGLPVFDIEHAKEVARDIVFSCHLTPSRLRELFPPMAHSGLANRQALVAKYHSMQPSRTCSACGRPL